MADGKEQAADESGTQYTFEKNGDGEFRGRFSGDKWEAPEVTPAAGGGGYHEVVVRKRRGAE